MASSSLDRTAVTLVSPARPVQRSHTREEGRGGRSGAGVISVDCERTVAPLGELAIMGETMFTSISCQEDLWPHFAIMEN